jgi:hypothetical protein
MKHHLRVMLALVVFLVAAAVGQRAVGQTRTSPARPPAHQHAKPNPYRQASTARTGNSPPKLDRPGGAIHSHDFAGDPFASGDYAAIPDGIDGYSADGPCASSYGGNVGCCDGCGAYGCDGMCWYRGGYFANLFGMTCPPGRFFVTADYLYVRANFSEAIAFLEQVDDQQQGIGTDEFHELDFQYESSYRFGGGYRMGQCGDEVRFLFTRLSSFADDIAPPGSFIPYEVSAPPDGETRIHADVDVKSYDLEFAKTIPLGGGSDCGCGDPCGDNVGYGYGDACGCGCPVWDVTWSGGLRFVDAGWNRTYTAVNADQFVTTQAVSVLDFRGGGLRVGLEGRRYFFQNGCMSVYLKGDVSLLLGDIRHNATRTTDDPTTPDDVDTLITQSFDTRQIIPVTELETGLTGHITCNTSITAGYLFSAWHDLGFRDEFRGFTNQGVSFLETGYDDANILGFDGFFARLEVAY